MLVKILLERVFLKQEYMVSMKNHWWLISL